MRGDDAVSEKKKPWFKWWPTAWRGETSLKLVSRAARSLWVDILGLMHESPLIGYLYLNNGTPPTLEDLSRVLGDTPEELRTLLAELKAAGVYSETDEGVIYSRKMVRDAEISAKGREDIKNRGGAWGLPNGKSVENTDRHPNRVPMPDPNTKRIEDRGESKNTVGVGTPTVQADEVFEEFWKAYPRSPNMSKAEARKSWAKLRKEGAVPEQAQILKAVEAYKRFLAEQSKGRREPHPAAHAVTWLNQRRYEGFLDSTVPSKASALAPAQTGPGWEAAYPKSWGKIREFFKSQYGNDVVWQNFFAGCEARSETEIVCRSRFARDALVEKFSDKVARVIGADVSFVFEPQATH